MQWSVEGANVESGEDVAVIVEAITRAEAEAEARRRGVLVASITPLGAPSLADEVATARAERQSKTTQALGYQSGSARATPPKYVGLRIASSVLSIIAMLYYAAGLYLLTYVAYTSFRSRLATYGVESFVYILGPSFLLLAIGGLCHGISAGCIALRDIAINSFARR